MKAGTPADYLKLSSTPLGVARSERFCLPAKVGPYSVHALDQVCARDAQAKSDGGIIPAVNHPPLQQNSVRLCQISDQGATSVSLHVFTIVLNPASMLHAGQDLATYRVGMGAPTGFSVHGWLPPSIFRVQVDLWTSVAAAGVAVRYIALARRDTFLALQTYCRPRNPRE